MTDDAPQLAPEALFRVGSRSRFGRKVRFSRRYIQWQNQIPKATTYGLTDRRLSPMLYKNYTSRRLSVQHAQNPAQWHNSLDWQAHYHHSATNIHCQRYYREGTFLLGGWAGASEGRVISKIFRKWGGPDLLEPKSKGGSHILYKNKKFTACDFYKISFCIQLDFTYKQSMKRICEGVAIVLLRNYVLPAKIIIPPNPCPPYFDVCNDSW